MSVQSTLLEPQSRGTWKRMIHVLPTRHLLSYVASKLANRSTLSSLSVATARSFGCYGCSYSQVFMIRKDSLLLSSSRKIYSGFSSSASEDLTLKKCVSCDSKDQRPMSEQAANELLPKVEGWSLFSEDGVMKLHRAWKVKTFTKGLEFFHLVADIAEREGHHPDLHLVGWNNVKIDIWTHSIGGLTENDFILAAKINALNVEPLLRKKAAMT